MSFTQRLINALDAGLFKFVKAVFNTNRDFPYHDKFYAFVDEQEDTITGSYAVGENNILAHGNQHKHFVAKRTIIWSTNPLIEIRLNHATNVIIPLIPSILDSTDGYIQYKIELHCNISRIYYSIPEESLVEILFEGVLPQEARNPE